MVAPPSSPPSSNRANLLGGTFAIGGAILFSLFIPRVTTLTSHGYISALKSSSWGTAVAVDYFAGTAFTALYIWLRNGPQVLIFHPKVVALIFPLLTGNFLPLFYIAYLILSSKDVEKALIPNSSPETEAVFEPPPQTEITKVIATFFAALIVVTGAASLRALLTQRVSDGFEDFANFYHFTLVMDLVIGIWFPIVFIAIRERGDSALVLPWVVAMIFFGNAITALYVIKVAHESLTLNSSFRYLLLSHRPQVVQM